MAEPAKIDLNTVKRGDTYIVDFFFTDTDGTKDISGITIDAQARREMDGALWFDLKPKVIDASNGHFRIHMTHDETRSITESPPGSFSGIYDIQFSWAGANETYVSTIVAGSISISKDVTQPTTLVTGGTPVINAPTNSQVNVYYSLNPGTPNYSDVVTAEQLTPVQYNLVASLGLANINYINEAGEAAKVAKAAAAEAEADAKAAKQSEQIATVQAAKATSEAAKAKQSADDAARVVTGGTATLTSSPGKIPLANSEGKIDDGWIGAVAKYCRTQADMEQMIRENERKFAASGFVDFGLSRTNPSGYEYAQEINEGLWARWADANYANTIQVGLEEDTTGVTIHGASKTGYPVTQIAGFVSNIIHRNPTTVYGYSDIKLPEASKGYDVYDSSGNVRGTGKATLNLRTEIDPKYGTIAPTDNEAVARAFEGGKWINGDFRNGFKYWRNQQTGTGAVTNGDCVVTTVDENDGVGRDYTTQSGEELNLQAGVTYRFTANVTFPVGKAGAVTLYHASNTPASIESKFTGTGKAQQVTFDITPTAFLGAGGLSLNIVSKDPSPLTFTIHSVSFKEAGEEVVTERVDVFGGEFFLEEITDANDDVYPYGMIQSELTGTVDGAPLTKGSRPTTYYAVFEGDTSSRGNSWKWNSLTDAQKAKIVSNEANNLFLLDDGRLVQWRMRQRSIAGAGNGDWQSLTIQNIKNGAMSWVENGTPYCQCQGISDTVNGFSNNSKDIFVGNYHNSKLNNDSGVWQIHTNSNRTAITGFGAFHVWGQVSRLNQGAYHPTFNEMGASMFVDQVSGFGEKWYEPATGNVTDTLDCFRIGSVGTVGRSANSGKISTGNSGHPEGRFYDAIYASGQGGVLDDRLSAWDMSSPEEAAKIDAKVKNGTYRGKERLVYTFPTEMTHPDGAGTRSTIYVSTENIADEIAIGSFVGGSVGTGRVTGAAFVSGKGTYVTTLDGSFTVTSSPYQICYTTLTNLSVEGDFLCRDVIGDPANILQVQDLSQGWYGYWIPEIPDGVGAYTGQMTRKSLVTTGDWVQTLNNGVTWPNVGGAGINGTTNRLDSSLINELDSVSIVSYTAAAYVTEQDVNRPVLNAEKGLGQVWGIQGYQTVYGVGLAESLVNKVCTSSVAGIAPRPYGVPYNWYFLGDNSGGIGAYDGSAPTHTPLTLPAPNNDSPAVKALMYQTAENQGLYLNYAYNELVYDNTVTLPTGSGMVTRNSGTSYSYTSINQKYYFNAGNHSGKAYRLATNTGTITVDSDTHLGADNNLYHNTTGALILEAWNYSGWGDDSTIKIADGQKTDKNLNGDTILIGTNRLTKRYGYSKNQARAGTQVPGVDL